jgi:hypothetical protein
MTVAFKLSTFLLVSSGVRNGKGQIESNQLDMNTFEYMYLLFPAFYMAQRKQDGSDWN